MKHYLLGFLFVALISCNTYQYITTDIMVKVYEDLNDNQSALFVKSNDWMIRTFKDATSVIQYSDKTEGVLIGKYCMYGKIVPMPYNMTDDTRIFAIIDIRVKDNKARISIQPQGPWKYLEGTINGYSYNRALFDMEALCREFYETLKTSGVDF
jgi:hypothetical protein